MIYREEIVMKKRLVSAAAALLVLISAASLGFTGCEKTPDDPTEETTMSPEQVAAVQTLRLPYSKADKMNPFTATSMLNQQLSALIYDSLFTLDKNYNAKPALASSYSQSGRVLTVSLASAKFSDGSSVTASDVVASFNSAKDSPAYKARLSGFSSAKVSGNSVVFSLSADDPYAVNCLTFAVTKGGSKDEGAVGSGRYTYSVETGVGHLKLNSRHSGFSPKKDSITLHDVKDISVLKYTLEIGNISFAFDDLRDGAYTRYSASTSEILMNNLVFMTFNKSSSVLSSEKVRQAISLLIDREKIADEAFQGHAQAAYTPFNPDWNVLSGKDYTIKTDLEAAGKLLDEAGFVSKNGSTRANSSKKQLSLNILVNSDNGFKAAAAVSIKEMLEKAKIAVTVTSVSEKEYLTAVSSGKYDIYIGEVKLTANMNLSPLLKSGGSVTSGINTSGAASTAYDAFLTGSTDVFAFIDAFNSDLPFIPLCYRSGIAVYTRTLKYGSGNHANDIYADIDTWDFH